MWSEKLVFSDHILIRIMVYARPLGGPIYNWCKWRHLVAKFATDASSATWWPHLYNGPRVLRNIFKPKLFQIDFSQNQMALLALVIILLTEADTCTSDKFCHQMVPFALVVNLATRWCYLHQLQIVPPGGATCIWSKFGHQVAPLAFPNCLGLPY